MQIERPSIACPFQCLHVWTNTDAGHNSKTFPIDSSMCFSDKESLIVISVPGLPAGEKYYSNFSILDQAGIVVDMGNPHFFSK